VLQLVIKLVLATDMKLHFSLVGQFNAVRVMMMVMVMMVMMMMRGSHLLLHLYLYSSVPSHLLVYYCVPCWVHAPIHWGDQAPFGGKGNRIASQSSCN